MQPCFLLSEVQHVNPIDRSVRGISFKDAAVITISKAQPDGIRWRVAGLALRSLLGKLGLQRWQPISPLVSVTTTVRCGAASGLWRTPHWLTSEWGFFARPCHRGGLLATDRNVSSSSSSFDESFNTWSTSLTAIVSAHSPLSS